MRIAIIGAAGEGKTRFVDTILFPALLSPQGNARDYGFHIYDNTVSTAHRGGKPMVVIATFNDVLMAQRFLEGKVHP